jgi:hypothetical protein
MGHDSAAVPSPTALTAVACALSCVAGDRHLLWAEGLGAAFLALHKRVDELYDELVVGEPEQQSLTRALG